MAQNSSPSDIDKQLLAQLLTLINEPDFPDLFQRITHTETNNARFLLKMELSRLKTPCQRLIDLRGKVDADCKPYIHKNITHYLDEKAIEFFEQALSTFGGIYTIGVYEKTLTTPTQFSVISKKQINSRNIATTAQQINKQKTEKPYLANIIHFANVHGRNEERLHLAVPVLAGLPSGKIIQIMSSNISTTGLRVKVPDDMQFPKGTILKIFLTSLEKEFVNTILKVGIPYKVMGSETKDEQQWLRLMLLTDFERFDEYQAFISQFLARYKGRYRVDVKNLTNSLTVRGFEQFYLPRMSALPLFFSTSENNDTEHRLDSVLCNEYNQSQLDYWRDEHNRSLLHTVFSPERMSLLQSKKIQHLLIYCFSYAIKGKIYFYSASLPELEASGFKMNFFAFGSRRASWRVYQLSLFDIDKQNALVSINVDLNPHEKSNTNKFIQNNIEKKLDNLSYAGYLQEITHDKLASYYQEDFKTVGDANLLKCFAHKPITSNANSFDTLTLKYVQMRSEDRFSYKTAISLKYQEQTHLGWSSDFSTKGMRIELETPANLTRGDIIGLSMPQFNKLSKSANLIDLPYEVVNFNQTQTIINLKIVTEQEQHQGKKFLANLISINKNKLNIIHERAPMAGLAEVLRNISCQGLQCLPFYVHKRKHRLIVDTVGRSGTYKPLNELIATKDDNTLDLSPLLGRGLFNSLLQDPLKTARVGSLPTVQELYISWQTTKDRVKQVQLDSDFKNEIERKLFVANALQTGQFSSVVVSISRTGRPDMDFISNELAYISQYALHKAKELEGNLWSVIGVGEFIDSTAETLARLALRKPG